MIDTDRTTFRITFKPGIPGLGVHITGVSGEFTATLDEHGTPDLDQPIEGSFAMRLDDLQLGNRLITAAVKGWLGGDTEVPITGRLGAVTPIDGHHHLLELLITMQGTEHRIESRGSTEVHEDGTFVVHGTATVDPRDVGVPIPSFLGLRTRASWRIHLLDA